MTDEQRLALENLPPEEPGSRLDPFRPFILRWRREGRSYDRICEILADKCGVKVARSTLREFIKRRARPRQQIAAEESTPPLPPSAALLVESNSRSDRYAAERERMRRFKEAPPPPQPRKIFEISEEDFEKPLQMMPPQPPKEK